jgi:MFS family permease
LGSRVYRELWLGNAASNFGSQIQVVGAGWLMASLTHSPQLIALVQTAMNLPTVFFILMGGALADNYDRRRMMLVAQSVMLLLAALLAILAWGHWITPWSLLAITCGISAFGSISNPAWQASVRDILPRNLISRAVALNSTSINLARTVGPALGGLIVASAGVAAAFVANAISFIAFLSALFRWKPETRPRTQPRERIFPAMAAGMRYVWSTAHIRNIFIRGGLSGLSASAVFALLPVVARQRMAGNATLYGLLLAAFGFGAVFSALLGGWLRSHFSPDWIVRAAVLALVLGLAILGWAEQPVLAALGAALGGSGWTLTHSTYNATVQLSADKSVTARALASYQTATFAGMAVGSWLFGWIAEHQSLSIALYTASVVHALGGIIGLFLPLPHHSELVDEKGK